MLRRLAAVAALCTAIVPALGGTASASCVDDLESHPVLGSTPFYPSDHYLNWVHVEGTATVIVEGDDLLYDVTTLAALYPVWTQATAGNAVDATGDFANCVAG
jgi:hypothetical protein